MNEKALVQGLAKKDQFLNCRVLGHAWDQIPNTVPAPFGVGMMFRCIRCSMTRRDIISRFTGDLLSRRYYQPEGYRREPEERYDFSTMRAALFEKVASSDGT